MINKGTSRWESFKVTETEWITCHSWFQLVVLHCDFCKAANCSTGIDQQGLDAFIELHRTCQPIDGVERP